MLLCWQVKQKLSILRAIRKFLLALTMQLKIYQENAIDELLGKTKRLLELGGNKKLVFKASTGSGKTIMMAEIIVTIFLIISIFVFKFPKNLKLGK